MALRAIPFRIPSFEELGLPPIIEQLANLPQGLLLVTGPTGSGKSTTQASVIDYINANRECHILTIEDPIEYVHRHKRSAVNQREVGFDTDSFERALRSALREDPDVILVGEMRDPETIQFALDDRRDRPPRLRDVAHQRRHDRPRPHRRRVPGRASAADPRAARRVARRRHQPTSDPAHGQRPRGRVRGHHREQPDPEPDPRGQDPPDPQRRLDEPARGHADDGSRARTSSSSRA